MPKSTLQPAFKAALWAAIEENPVDVTLSLRC